MTDITPKPMSAERRAEIEIRWLEGFGVDYNEMIDVLADAAFWREAVRKTQPVVIAGNYYLCYSCEGRSRDFTEIHKPDCPWWLAQEN